MVIQEKHLYDIMAHEVGTFLGEATEVLIQIQIMEKWFFSFLNSGDGHIATVHLCLCWVWRILTLTCV